MVADLFQTPVANLASFRTPEFEQELEKIKGTGTDSVATVGLPKNDEEVTSGLVVRIARGLIAQADTKRFLVKGFEIVRAKPCGWEIAGHRDWGVFPDPLEAALRIG